MYDVLDCVKEKTIACLDKGFVTLIDAMPRLIPDGQTADQAIVQMARVSYGDGTKTINEDKGLIRYLIRNSHTSPLEAVEFKFHIKMPIFCARQFQRHRSASLNETSGRYSVMKDEFYIPSTDGIRKQSLSNKQGGGDLISKDDADTFIMDIEKYCNDGYVLYQKYLDVGMSREQARMLLSLNLYTEFYWKQDLHNLLHLLALRCDGHTQWETRVFADAMLKLIQPVVPLTMEAWNDYHPMRGAVKLTRLEVDALKKYLSSDDKKDLTLESNNKREQAEWNNKLLTLGVAIND